MSPGIFTFVGMKPLILLFLVMTHLWPQSYTIRQAYNELPLDLLPATKSYLYDKVDNKENRDRILVYHNEERDFIRLKHDGSPLLGKLKLYQAADLKVVAIEHSFCQSGNCENYLSLARKELKAGYREATAELLPDYPLEPKSWRALVKQAMKDAYGNNDMFEGMGYEDDAVLQSHIIWQLDEQSGQIQLVETTMPVLLARYTWNAKKARFDKI